MRSRRSRNVYCDEGTETIGQQESYMRQQEAYLRAAERAAEMTVLYEQVMQRRRMPEVVAAEDPIVAPQPAEANPYSSNTVWGSYQVHPAADVPPETEHLHAMPSAFEYSYTDRGVVTRNRTPRDPNEPTQVVDPRFNREMDNMLLESRVDIKELWRRKR